MNKLKILVTGSTGMVGYHACRRMLAEGHTVRALVRNIGRAELLKDLQSERLSLMAGDVSSLDSVSEAVSTMDVVVHTAGIVDPLARREDIQKVNVEGTRLLLQAAEVSGIKQFIHISSLSVITGQKDQYAVTESEELKPCGEAYADSKVEAERLVISYAKNLWVTILRPGFIYGPMERAWMPRLMNNLATKRAMLIDGGIKETNVIYIENLMTALSLALLNEKTKGEVFNLTDGQKITKKMLFDTVCDTMGYARITKRIPSFVAAPVCEIVSMFAPYLPEESRKNLSRFSRAAFRLAGVNQGFDISKAEHILNYKDRIPFRQGMQKSLEWFKNQESPKTGETLCQSSAE